MFRGCVGFTHKKVITPLETTLTLIGLVSQATLHPRKEEKRFRDHTKVLSYSLQA
jgi:hypothetical protein